MQLYMNSRSTITLEQMKKSPKKQGWLQKKMAEAQEIAAKQGRTLPGSRSKPLLGLNRVISKAQKRKKLI